MSWHDKNLYKISSNEFKYKTSPRSHTVKVTCSLSSGIGKRAGPKHTARLYGYMKFSSLNCDRWLRKAKRYLKTTTLAEDKL